jgi:hypothetical protein
VCSPQHLRLSFPDSKVVLLSRPISHHIPYLIQISTQKPKSPIFRFENYWVEFEGFFDTVKLNWESNPFFGKSQEPYVANSSKLEERLKHGVKRSPNLAKTYIIVVG